MMYSALQTWKSGDDGLPVAGGTARGLLAAAGATLLGLFGSIGALAWVSAGRDGHRGGAAFVVVLFLVSLLVVAYSVRTITVLLRWATSPDPSALQAARPSLLVGIVTRRCCAEQETSVVVNLL